jgi:hypothetical protein
LTRANDIALALFVPSVLGQLTLESFQLTGKVGL